MWNVDISVLCCLKEGYNLAKKCSGDVHTFLPGKPKDGTSDIDVRVIEVTLDDGTKEYLATLINLIFQM